MIKISNEIAHIFPNIKIGYIKAVVKVEDSSTALINEINKITKEIESNLTINDTRENAIIKSSKNAYRKLGKDPNRYRPSAESLQRRVIQGKGLYNINNVVDTLNLVSIKTGFSICGYDYNKIKGDITLRKGGIELYEGIGRGKLNIENLPVFSDDLGAFGSPTSDSTRTMVDKNTTKILFIFISFENEEQFLKATIDITLRLFREHGISNNFNSAIL